MSSIRQGRTTTCENKGKIVGTLNLGGIVGTIGIESDLNPEDDIINVDTFINTEEMKKLQLNYFYTFDEYKSDVIKFHNLISKHYVSQTTKNFDEQYSALNRYLLNHPVFVNTHKKFIDGLQFFKDPSNFGKKLPDEMINGFIPLETLDISTLPAVSSTKDIVLAPICREPFFRQ